MYSRKLNASASSNRDPYASNTYKYLTETKSSVGIRSGIAIMGATQNPGSQGNFLAFDTTASNNYGSRAVTAEVQNIRAG